jgi:hypothetical protein
VPGSYSKQALACCHPLDVTVEEATLLGLEPVEEGVSCSQEETTNTDVRG